MIITTRRSADGRHDLDRLRRGAACSWPSGTQEPTATGGSVGFTNPVVEANVPDPMIIADDDGGWWAFATNGNGANIQTLRSTDLVTWEQAPDALPQLAGVDGRRRLWAPEVARGEDGRWLMYYTTPAPERSRGHPVHRTWPSPTPPADRTSTPPTEPLVCETDDGGSIDAHPFTAPDGQRYLYWKNDGNRIGVDTWISVQRLDPSGTKLVGEADAADQAGPAVGGETWSRRRSWSRPNGTFWLFYSGQRLRLRRVRGRGGPGDQSDRTVHQAARPGAGQQRGGRRAGSLRRSSRSADQRWMVYHAWPPDAIGSTIPGRTMWLSEVEITADEVARDPADGRLPEPTARLSRSGQLGQDQLAHPGRVGLTTHLLHHRTDQGSRRLHLAAADLLRDVGVGGDRGVDGRAESASRRRRRPDRATATTSAGEPSPARTPSITCRASLSLTVLSSTSSCTSATCAGVMPASARSTPASLACREISVNHHLRALCADAPAATVCSIRSTAPALTTSRISSSVKPQSCADPLQAGRRRLGQGGSQLLHPGPARSHRHQVRLGEVAVVLRGLLAPTRTWSRRCPRASAGSPG